MKCNNIICGEVVLIDRTTQKTSIVNIIQDTLIKHFPFAIPFNVYLIFEKNDEDAHPPKLEMVLKLNELTLGVSNLDVKFTNTSNQSGLIVGVGIITLPFPGVLTVLVRNKVDGNILNEHRISFASLPQITEPTVTQTAPL